MSSTVRSRGFIAQLVNPVTDEEEREALSERMWEGNSNLEINYEGTLVFLDQMRSKPLSEREDIYHLTINNNGGPEGAGELYAEALKYGLSAINAVPFDCIWYNGSDSPMSMLTLHEFLTEIKKV